jgi:two-component system NarL family sensor kinase
MPRMLGRRQRHAADPTAARPRVGPAVTRFMIGSLAAIIVVLASGLLALRSVAIGEAERETRERVQLQGRLVEAAGMSDGVLREKPGALARLDDLVQGRILNESVVRVKIWSQGGTILYSDEPALIGRRFSLAPDELRLFHTGGSEAELSDLSKPENRYERGERKLLEAHTTIRTPNGTQVLFEVYRRFDSVSANAERLLLALAPPLLGGLLVLLLFQAPLAWSMARRLQRGYDERERLLASAIEASTRERQLIAADLHDSVVQDVAGVAFGLAPLAESAARRGDAAEAGALRGSIARLRQGVRDLRTLLVEIHPPSLESAGLEAALNDLLSPLQTSGIATELHVDDSTTTGSDSDPLIYRVAREAVRNVRAHAGAASIEVSVTRPQPGITRLVVRDDGRGFDPQQRGRHGANGHMGLTLLADLVSQANGSFAVTSKPGAGTTVELEVPA